MAPPRFAPADAVDVLLTILPAARPVRDRDPVRVHREAAVTEATVFLQTGRELAPATQGLAQLRFTKPVTWLGGDLLRLQDASGQAALAEARVLDPDGHRKHWQHRAHRALLAARAAAPDNPEVWVASQLARDGLVPRLDLLAKTRFTPAQAGAALTALVHRQQAILAGDFAADAARWQDWIARATAAVDQTHHAHPEWPGLPIAGLQALFTGELVLPGAFETLLAILEATGFVRQGERLGRATHRPTLPPRLAPAGRWLRTTLTEKPFEPPARKELVSDRASQEALQCLLDAGEAVAVGDNLVLSRDAYEEAVARVQAHLHRHGPATVGQLREAVGCTRRLMVPLVEQLDRLGLTRREGDHRRLP